MDDHKLDEDTRRKSLEGLAPVLADYDQQRDFHPDDDDDDSLSPMLGQGKGVPGQKGPGDKLSALTQKLLSELTEFWPEHSLKDAFGDGRSKQSDHQDENPFQHWVELAEDLVAIQIVIYLSQFFFQMRNLIWSMTVCGTLLLLGSTSYPFQPERVFLTLLLSLLGAVLAGIVYVLVLMNRDELLSRIARMTPNRFNLDWDFATSILTYIVPMGTVIALQISGAFRFLLEPLVRMVH
jgi:hypothetical protein